MSYGRGERPPYQGHHDRPHHHNDRPPFERHQSHPGGYQNQSHRGGHYQNNYQSHGNNYHQRHVSRDSGSFDSYKRKDRSEDREHQRPRKEFEGSEEKQFSSVQGTK